MSSTPPIASADKASADLEWFELLERIARRAAGDAAARRLRELSPAAEIEDARQRCRVVADALELSQADAPLPGAKVEEMAPLLARLRRGAVAGADELASLRTVLRTAASLRAYAARQREQHPALAAAIGSAPELDEFLKELEHALDESGAVADRASPGLAAARQRVASLRRELSTRIDRLISRYSEVLRDNYYAERDGRYVLPVRADAHRRVPGIVLGSSASGGTLYVEPQEITELGNRLGVAEAEAEREEARVLARLCDAAAAQADELSRAYEACLAADQLSAIARWAAEAEGVVVAPEMDAGIDLGEMRHPLLIGSGLDEVVPNDIRLSPGSGLVISGPNAGGKTVALKCLGLAAWMARAGLPLPAAPGSRVGWFDNVLTDVGDDQSLARSLSTFSAHIEKLARFVEHANPRTLVLLDEVAAGTDPEEGSALAVAVLEKLVQRGATVAVTTHYERLKELPVDDDHFVNASVGFDFGAMKPTFKLELGVPGASSALAVAARHGMPPDVIQRAEQLMPEHARRREELVAELEAEQRALEQARREAEAEARRQKQLGAEVETELARQREQDRRRAEQQARELTAGSAAGAGRAPSSAGAPEAGRARQAAGARRGAEREQRRPADRHRRPSGRGGGRAAARAGKAGQPLAIEELVAGARVYVPGIDAIAEVLAPPAKGQVRVVGRCAQAERPGGVPRASATAEEAQTQGPGSDARKRRPGRRHRGARRARAGPYRGQHAGPEGPARGRGAGPRGRVRGSAACGRRARRLRAARPRHRCAEERRAAAPRRVALRRAVPRRRSRGRRRCVHRPVDRGLIGAEPDFSRVLNPGELQDLLPDYRYHAELEGGRLHHAYNGVFRSPEVVEDPPP